MNQRQQNKSLHTDNLQLRVVRNRSDVSEWTADTALAVLLKDLKAAYSEGLKHNVVLPFNTLSSVELFNSMGKEKPDAK